MRARVELLRVPPPTPPTGNVPRTLRPRLTGAKSSRRPPTASPCCIRSRRRLRRAPTLGPVPRCPTNLPAEQPPGRPAPARATRPGATRRPPAMGIRGSPTHEGAHSSVLSPWCATISRCGSAALGDPDKTQEGRIHRGQGRRARSKRSDRGSYRRSVQQRRRHRLRPVRMPPAATESTTPGRQAPGGKRRK